jgi:hypothetical protein
MDQSLIQWQCSRPVPPNSQLLSPNFLLVTNGHQIIIRFDPLTTDHGGG